MVEGFSTEECAINTEKAPHFQCRQGCDTLISYIIRMDDDLQYETTKTAQVVVGGYVVFILKMIFYRQSLCNLDFILLLLYIDLDEIPLVC